MQEIWKDIKSFEGLYQVSNLGRVKTLERKSISGNGGFRTIKSKILKQRSGNRYTTVSLCRGSNNTRVVTYIHRLVAETFLQNPDNKQVINHKNGLKFDNTVDNLEWVTYSENRQHACDTGLVKAPWKGKSGCDHHSSKTVIQYNLSTGEVIREYGSQCEASRITGIDQRNISNSCRNGAVAGGFIWKFKIEK